VTMAEHVVEPRIRGFISLTAHPDGCAEMVRRQVDQVRAALGSDSGALGNVLVVGSSTGYGLASALVAAFGYGANTLGVCFEREPTEDKTATAGWYNLAEAHRLAAEAGIRFETVNADAFAQETKDEVIAALHDRFGPIDVLVYSLAAPRRNRADGGHWNSVLKPIGERYEGKAFDLRGRAVVHAGMDPADDEEIESTVRVMGGEDWQDWVAQLGEAGLLADGVRTVALSYIGPELSAPIYRRGTIGRAKEHLEATAHDLDAALAERGGHAYVSVNTGIVTQSSSAIPAVPLYMSALFRVMQDQGKHENSIDQAVRLFRDHIGPGAAPTLDEEGRIRLDDREMTPEVQASVAEIWETVTTENLDELTDFAKFERDFRQLFGFEVEGVDYAAPTEVNRPLV
jgi:enoyl-[acyl-carrier protein] reductase/trans-2-enoyl-CoA reductase (NAD+)